jgi:hypothetical protein
MKDIITRIFVTLIGIGLLVYTGWLFAQGVQIVLPARATRNMTAYGIVFAVSAALMLVFGIYPVPFKRMKRSLTAAGILSILFGFYVLRNDPNTTLFIGDLVRVL